MPRQRAVPHIQTSLRITQETDDLIERLAVRFGCTRAAAVTKGIELLAIQSGPLPSLDESSSKTARGTGNRGGGRRPYGETEEEQETLRRMITLKSEGLSYQQVADKLNKEGHSNKSGNPWTKGNIDSVLKSNPR
jgi:hypothetical protein